MPWCAIQVPLLRTETLNPVAFLPAQGVGSFGG